MKELLFLTLIAVMLGIIIGTAGTKLTEKPLQCPQNALVLHKYASVGYVN